MTRKFVLWFLVQTRQWVLLRVGAENKMICKKSKSCTKCHTPTNTRPHKMALNSFASQIDTDLLSSSSSFFFSSSESLASSSSFSSSAHMCKDKSEKTYTLDVERNVKHRNSVWASFGKGVTIRGQVVNQTTHKSLHISQKVGQSACN